MKIVTWNINGIRSGWIQFLDFVKNESPDIICLQETKIAQKDLTPEIKDLPGYNSVYCHAQKAGYSGVAIYSKLKPKKIRLGIGIDEFDNEGRNITAWFDDFVLINCYFPNSGRGLSRLEFKHKYNMAIKKYIGKFSNEKVIICGDMNVAHEEIDIARPKENKKSAGFTQEERNWMSNILSEGLVDVYRFIYPDKVEYTWWSNFFSARSRNIGWRIDYFLTNQKMIENIEDCRIITQQMGSDHCPVILKIK